MLAAGPDHLVVAAATLEDGVAWCRQTLGIEPAPGIEAGPLISAERMTPGGLLRWRIAVRDDGHLLFGGSLPTVIEWGPVHPTAAMPGSPVLLELLQVSHPHAVELEAALTQADLAVAAERGPDGIHAVLRTPLGQVHLSSLAG